MNVFNSCVNADVLEQAQYWKDNEASFILKKKDCFSYKFGKRKGWLTEPIESIPNSCINLI